MNTISITNNNPLNFNLPNTPNVRPSKRKNNSLVVNSHADINRSAF